MTALLRIIAVLAAISTVVTVTAAISMFRAGAGPALLSSALGVATILGWLITLVAGPVAAFQMWRLKESGRRAGLLLFGYALLFYAVGWFVLASPEAQVLPVITAALSFAVPVAILLSPAARRVCTG